MGGRTTRLVQEMCNVDLRELFRLAPLHLFMASQVVGAEQATFVCNSIGSISSLQAAVDRPDLVNGVMIVNPNFRELHVAEQPDLFRPIMMPLVSAVQATLRERGHGLFNALAKPDTVKQILKEPYHNPDSVRNPRRRNLAPLSMPFAAASAMHRSATQIPGCSSE